METRSHKAPTKKPVASAIILARPNTPSKFPNPAGKTGENTTPRIGMATLPLFFLFYFGLGSNNKYGEGRGGRARLLLFQAVKSPRGNAVSIRFSILMPPLYFVHWPKGLGIQYAALFEVPNKTVGRHHRYVHDLKCIRRKTEIPPPPPTTIPIIIRMETPFHKAPTKKPVASAIILPRPNTPSKFPNPAGKQEKIRPPE
ncbi:hypothetical protein CDAR_595551 [Caerostris darwini]|uniref:Uncharacterized protein n=1 Tax=Caerostris darwini TaxID=1538125 RepID=A0AAV4P8C8_9ARAC|nr:hypothetical protein CDAR_595551 [Caerostris darwini]